MKNLVKSIALLGAVALGSQFANAQSYRDALGLAVDLGDGPTLFGPQYKHSFDGRNAGNVQVLFGDNTTVLGADYTYNQKFNGAGGLGWYIGVGPQLTFWKAGGNSDTSFAIRPQLGLEYKIPSAPLAMSFDWKPWWNLSNDSNFEAGRFTLGFKYVLK